MRNFLFLLVPALWSLPLLAQEPAPTAVDSTWSESSFIDVAIGLKADVVLDVVTVPSFTLGSEREIGHQVEWQNATGNLPLQNASDALERRFASVDIRSRSLNDVQSDISIRGSTFDQVLILVNGIPYSDPQTGHHSMNLPVPMEAISSIQVLPSGGSYRYGPFAFAGVVNLTTHPAGSKNGYAHAGLGQFGYQRGAAGLYLGQVAGTSLRMDMDYKAADGAFVNTDFSQMQTYVRTLTPLSGNHFLDGHFGMVTKRFGAQNFYSFNFPEQYEAIAGYTMALQLRGYPWNAQVYGRQHQDHFELFREEQGYYQRFENGQFMRTTDSTWAPSWYTEHNNHRTRTLGGEVTYSLKPHEGVTMLLGADARRDEIVSNALGNPLLVQIPAPDNRSFYTKGDARQNAGLFLSLKGPEVYKAFRARADMRLNYNDRYGLTYLPNAEFSYRHTPMSLRFDKYFFSINRSFRLPTFTDLYYTLGGAQGSANLQPEYAWNTELGTTLWRSPITVRPGWPHQGSLILYQRQGTNLIDWIYRTVDGNQVLQADNITQVTLQGYELTATWSWVDVLTCSARFQGARHQASAIDGQSIYALDYLANRQQLEVETLPYKGFTSGLILMRQDRSGQYSLPSGELTAYQPFTTLDAKMSYDHDGMTVYLEAMNLLNATVIDRGNVPLPGRWIKAGVHFHWN